MYAEFHVRISLCACGFAHWGPTSRHRHHTHTVYISFKWNFISCYKPRLASFSHLIHSLHISVTIRHILILSDCNTQSKWVVCTLSLRPTDFNMSSWDDKICDSFQDLVFALLADILLPNRQGIVYCLYTLAFGITECSSVYVSAYVREWVHHLGAFQVPYFVVQSCYEFSSFVLSLWTDNVYETISIQFVHAITKTHYHQVSIVLPIFIYG